MFSFIKKLLLGAGLLAWIGAPIVGTYLLSQSAEGLQIAPAQEVTVPVEANLAATQTQVSLAIGRSPGPTLVAPAWTGTVTSVLAAPGSVLRSGDALLTVDRVERLILQSDQPFSRSLALGDSGSDVRTLNAALSQLGFAAGGSSTVSTSTVAGIRSLASMLGAPSVEPPVFDPTWFIFMPVPDLVVQSLSAQVGAPAPAVGADLLVGKPTITSARVVSLVEPSTTNGTPSVADEETEAAFSPASIDALPSVPVPGGAKLSVGVTELTLDETSASLSADSLLTLDALVPSTDQFIAATISQAAAPNTFAVPAAAIYVQPAGSTCVIRLRDGVRTPISVQIVGGNLDRTAITGEIDIDDDLLVSPPNSLRTSTCQ